MNHFCSLSLLVSGMCLMAAASAQEKLPAEMAGAGVYFVGRSSVSPWSIVIESQDADGTIKGKMSWGGRICQFTGLPFTGSYRDGVLEISAPQTHSQCGAWTITMKRTSATEFAFEGWARLSTTPTDTHVTLKPR